MNKTVAGRGKNLVKGEESESGRSLVSVLMTNQGIVIIGKIGTTETVTGTERRTGKETGVVRLVIVREDVTVIGAGTVVVVGTMNVKETGSVTVSALEKGTGRGIGLGKRIMKLERVSMTGGGPAIKIMIMTEWNQNMSETGMGWRGSATMIPLSLRRMILNGINTTVIMGTSVLKLNMMTMTDIMSIINKTVANMTIWMSKRLLLITTTMIILIVIVINMTKWRRTTTLMSERRLNSVKRRDLECLTVIMCDLKGLFLVSMNTSQFDFAPHILCFAGELWGFFLCLFLSFYQFYFLKLRDYLYRFLQNNKSRWMFDQLGRA